MEKKRRIPYGVINWATLVRECLFVDNTACIRKLEDVATPVFLRPKRFGKSIVCSMLAHYYDVGDGSWNGLFDAYWQHYVKARCDFLAIPKPGVDKPAQLVEFKYFTNAAAEKGNILGLAEPDAETVEQALAYRKALARRPDWNHKIVATVVEVCGSAGCNWFDLAD